MHEDGAYHDARAQQSPGTSILRTRTGGYSHALPIALQLSYGTAKRCNIWSNVPLFPQTPLPCHQ